VVNFTLRLLYPRKRTPVPIAGQVGLKSRRTIRRTVKSLAPYGIRNPDPPRSLITIPITLSWLPGLPDDSLQIHTPFISMSQILLTSTIGSSFLKSKNVDSLPSRHFTTSQAQELFGPRSVLIVYKQYVAIPGYKEKIMMHEERKTWVRCLQTSCRIASFTCCFFISTSNKCNSSCHASRYLNWLSMMSNTTRENSMIINEEVNKNCLHIFVRTCTYMKHTPYTLALTSRLTEVWGPIGKDCNNLSFVMCRASSGDEGKYMQC